MEVTTGIDDLGAAGSEVVVVRGAIVVVVTAGASVEVGVGRGVIEALTIVAARTAPPP